jgi:hypothetical protein
LMRVGVIPGDINCASWLFVNECLHPNNIYPTSPPNALGVSRVQPLYITALSGEQAAESSSTRCNSSKVPIWL